ncbi:hypothetical protein Tco_0903633 [Tanacetum coccineum]
MAEYVSDQLGIHGGGGGWMIMGSTRGTVRQPRDGWGSSRDWQEAELQDDDEDATIRFEAIVHRSLGTQILTKPLRQRSSNSSRKISLPPPPPPAPPPRRP